MKQILLLVTFLYLSVACSAVFSIEKDIYEMDDYKELATLIDVADTDNQHHNFHQPNDQDWFKFYVEKDQPVPYSIEVKNQQNQADVVIEVFDEEKNLIASVDEAIAGAGEYEILELKFPHDGIYYFRITQHDQSVYGEDTGYQVRLYHPVMQFKGIVITNVIDALSGQPVPSPTVNSTSADRTLYLGSKKGAIIMSHPAGNYSLTVMADDYESLTLNYIEVNEADTTFLDVVKLQPKNTSPQAVELKQADGVISFHIPRLFIGASNQSGDNFKTLLSFLVEDQKEDALIFRLAEIEPLDTTEKNNNYPAFISGTGILNIPLALIGSVALSDVSLQYITNTNPMRFELINYK